MWWYDRRLLFKPGESLKSLLNFFVDLCLLRAAPQDLNGSHLLLKITLILNLVLGVVMIAETRVGITVAILESVFEVSLMLVVLYIGLKLHGSVARFQQTATALMGSGVLLGLLALPLVAWSHHSESSEAGLLLLAVIIWSLVVMGHILRHTFDTRFGLGLGIAVLYTLVSWNLTFMLFPVVN
ncbi:MAG: hypothetical protein QNJ78_00880 [Gammaproteobacteria bacterium]|nr:hypothetical protein [Gammaproteobacteria bacterium]